MDQIENDIVRILKKEKDPDAAAKIIAQIYLPEADKELKFHPKASEILAAIRLHNKRNKIKSVDIEKQYGITGEQLRENVINPYRRRGEFICSDSSGYWYGTPGEAEECALFLRARAHKVLRAAEGMISGVNRAGKDLFGEAMQ